jgi:hypothetical protein
MAAFARLKKYIGMKGSPAAAKSRGRAASEIKPADLARLVISMSRLLNQLDTQPGLAKEKLAVAEWVTLTVLAESGKLSDRQLVKSLGVTGRRVREIIAALQRAGRVSYSAPAAGGARNVEMTEAGAESLANANAALMPPLEAVLKSRERMLEHANRQIRLLMRVAKPPRA